MSQSNRTHAIASSLLCLALGLCVTGEAVADEAARIRQDIAELKKRREYLKAHPLTTEQIIAENETQVMTYENDALKGDNRANQFLWMQRNSLKEIRRKGIQEKWGDAVLNRVETTQELRMHGRLMAELKRVRAVARARYFPDYVKQAEALIQTEQARHEARMQEIKQAAGGTAQMAGAN